MLNYGLFKDTKIELELLPHRPDADGPWQAKLTVAGHAFCTPARDPFTAVQSLLLHVYSHFDDRSEYARSAAETGLRSFGLTDKDPASLLRNLAHEINANKAVIVGLVVPGTPIINVDKDFSPTGQHTDDYVAIIRK